MKRLSKTLAGPIFSRWARRDGVPSRCRKSGASIVVFLTIMLTPGAQAAGQSHAAIEQAAVERVQEQLPATGNRREVRAQPVDPRLNLVACPRELETEVPAAFARGQRITVTVQCRGPQPWKIYVPVDVHEIVPVLVAARALARGAELRGGDLVVEEKSLSGLRRGYLRAGDPYVGMRVVRSVRDGQVMTPALVAAETVVRRGQTVTLVAAGRGLNVAVEGEALADGTLGQRIKVRNMSSNKEVEGIVRSRQRVEILLR